MKTIDNTEALNRFVSLTAQASELAQELSDYMSDHMELSPDSINWGHVGDASRILNGLKELTETHFPKQPPSMFKTYQITDDVKAVFVTLSDGREVGIGTIPLATVDVEFACQTLWDSVKDNYPQ